MVVVVEDESKMVEIEETKLVITIPGASSDHQPQQTPTSSHAGTGTATPNSASDHERDLAVRVAIAHQELKAELQNSSGSGYSEQTPRRQPLTPNRQSFTFRGSSFESHNDLTQPLLQSTEPQHERGAAVVTEETRERKLELTDGGLVPTEEEDGNCCAYSLQ